jgi:gluconolactonase
MHTNQRFWRLAALCNLVSSFGWCGCGQHRGAVQDRTPATTQPDDGGHAVSHAAGSAGEDSQAVGSAGSDAAAQSGEIAGSPAVPMQAPAGMHAATAGATPASAMAGAAASSSPPKMDSWPALTADMLGTPMRLANEYSLAEGPLWDHCGKQMLFTDVNNQVIHEIAADGTIGDYRTDTNYVNGLAFDMQGRLLMAEMGGLNGGRITRLEQDGTLTVLADKTPRGSKLNTSDDLIVRSDGTIYFTDPIIAHGNNTAVSLTNKPLYRLTPGEPGMVIEEDQLLLANGVDLSPDEKTLYASAFLGGQVFKYDVGEDGKLSGRQVFITGVSNPDSMCLDVAGNVYVGVSQGLLVVGPDGKRIKLISMSTNKGVTNCNFGGEDGKTLYITAWASLWKIDNMPIPGLDWTVDKRITCN